MKSDVRHARNANELLEVLGDELRPVVGNDSRFNARILLFGTFQNDLDVSLGHPLAKIPMNQETAVPVQDAAQAVERRANVQVRNIDMPMLVRLRRLFKPRSFLRGAFRSTSAAVPLDSVPATQLRDRHSFHQMPPQNGDLLVRGVVLPLFLHVFAPLS